MFGINSNTVQREASEILGKSQESTNRESFSREFSTSNFDSFGGDASAGQYNEVGRFRVPADTEYSWGYGKASAPENQGYIYIDLQDGTPEPVEGTLRLTVESSTGRRTEVVQDLSTERLDASKTDRTQMVALPEQVGSALASEDAYLVLRLNPNTDATVDPGNSDIIIPVTEYDLS